MALSFTGRKRIRKNFGRIPTIVEMPDLIEVQRSSYEQFLRKEVRPEDRDDTGLQGVLKSIFPISDFNGTASLEFVKYSFETPRYDMEECMRRDMTYAAPLKVTLRLIVFEIDEDTGAKSILDIKEQEVYMGEMPLMTDKGTFIVNGTERVIVSQVHRSPGVFFDHDRGKTHRSGKLLFAARMIPYRGSWLDFEFDSKDIVYVRIDRRRKLPATTMLYALGLSAEEMLNTYYKSITLTLVPGGWTQPCNLESFRGSRPANNLVDGETGEVIFEAGTRITSRLLKKLEGKEIKSLFILDEQLVGKYVAYDIYNKETGFIYLEAGQEITEEKLEELKEAGIESVVTLDIDIVNVGPWLRNTLMVDKVTSDEDPRIAALIEIYRVMRPGEPPTPETAEALFQGLFFDNDKYDLSAVGRIKLNSHLNLDIDDTFRVLSRKDIIEIIRKLLDLKDGRGEIDDIDHLGNRRVRSVGELIENQYRIGLLRMERAIRERMSSVDIDTVMPYDLINAKPAAAAIREFFGSSQLSQFMDQTNPLSEITHKRRLSALGPGGLTRERAGFEVRDVHPSHYGRICPIETPEGPNIGLINSLATYARVNKYGLIESPYRRVVDCKVTDEVIYLSAVDESKYTIAQANAELDDEGCITNEIVSSRMAGEFIMSPRKQIDFIDVSPRQLVSVAAAMVPFLENDDANRALMGANMQRQAVPLLCSSAPLVGTGMESVVAQDSGATVLARNTGIVDQVDATRIVVRSTEIDDPTSTGVDIYRMSKFQRSNQNTSIIQRPIVMVGDRVSKGDIIADGPSTDLGELALGRNVMVAFMPWNGYNFEDSILISERIVKDDVFTSIHIEEFEVMARDTKLGQEEISRDIPNVGEDALRNLDEAGIVYIGAEVKASEILVGKVTPKGETPMTPEEKLLRAIFGEKASDVCDTSLRVPPGVSGTIIEVRVFNRHGIDKDERALNIERENIESLAKDRDDERMILERSVYVRVQEMLQGLETVDGEIITEEYLQEIPRAKWWQISLVNEKTQKDLEELKKSFDKAINVVNKRFFDEKVDKLQSGDELPPGVMKMVKVFIAVKRKLQAGDKMAGRHGNKGVVSRILPEEDMPYMANGQPVDMVLNPLGVPSRMNVGQILETHLGWASAGIGDQISELLDELKHSKDDQETYLRLIDEKFKEVYGQKLYDEDISKLSKNERLELAGNLKKGVPMATPVFDGASEADINSMLKLAGLPTSGQTVLYDGRTGEPFDREVTVGYIYTLKLHHLVDDKIHARSIGPYSLVTQQPLGGKAQFGGQRFGEMEVWALQAYGAAYALQEMLTVKSDDVSGRTRVYEAIIRNDETFETGIPESFNVLVKELRSLCLNIELLESNDISEGESSR